MVNHLDNNYLKKNKIALTKSRYIYGTENEFLKNDIKSYNNIDVKTKKAITKIKSPSFYINRRLSNKIKSGKLFKYERRKKNLSLDIDAQKKLLKFIDNNNYDNIKDSLIINTLINKKKITIPSSPKLLTKYRIRPSLYKGHEQQEYENFLLEPKFHSHPLNYKIFEKTYGIPEPEKKTLTIPHSPNLTKKHTKYSIQNNKSIFDSNNDNNVNLLNKSYDFNLLSRQNKKISKDITLQKSSNSFSYSFSNSIPFHLPGDDISRKKILEFKEKIKREKDESDRLRQFIAQPIPNRVKKAVNHNIPIPIPLVQPVPFNLITEKRGIQYQKEFQKNIKKKQKEEDKLRKFVAKPPVILYKIPFTITKSDKPLTEFNDITLATERRSKEWIKFKNILKEKENQIEKLKKQQEEYQKLYEEQWLKEQRKKTIIHANPVPSYIYK